jgi:hypothetical protein
MHVHRLEDFRSHEISPTWLYICHFIGILGPLPHVRTCGSALPQIFVRLPACQVNNFSEISGNFSFPLVTGKRNFGIFRFEFGKFKKNWKKYDKKTRYFSKQIGLEHTQI